MKRAAGPAHDWEPRDHEPGLRDPEVDQRLDLEAVVVHPHIAKSAGPERVEAVAEVGVAGAVQQLTSPLSPRLPNSLVRMMSELGPPCAKRDPFTKSAPWRSAATNRGISAASVEPSGSRVTTMSRCRRRSRPPARLPFPAPAGSRGARRAAVGGPWRQYRPWSGHPRRSPRATHPEAARRRGGDSSPLVQGRDDDADARASRHRRAALTPKVGRIARPQRLRWRPPAETDPLAAYTQPAEARGFTTPAATR